MTAPAVQLLGLSKAYRSLLPWDRKAFQAVQSVALSVPTGEIYGLLGPNGAGKTTVIKMIAGLVLPDSGSILFRGSAVRPPFGAVLEGSRNLYWRLSVRENIEYFGQLKGIARSALRPQSAELLERFGLSGKLHQTAQTLSRGMQQKLAIVLALLGEPQLLLLDEPTLGLDVESALRIEQQLKQLVAERGITVLLTTHQMELAESLCRRVAIMRAGRIVVDRPVAELTGELRRHDYVLRLPAAALARLEPQLRAFAPVTEDSYREDEVVLRFGFDSPTRLYELISLLASQGVELLDIAQESPGLEHVFLKVAAGDYRTASVVGQ